MTILDSLVFIGSSYSGLTLGEDELIRTMDELGIERAAICPFRPPDYHLPAANSWTAAVAVRRPDRLVFLCRVDPNRADAVGEATRCFDDLGAVGLFLHPAEELFRANDARVDSVVGEAGRRGRPVLVASGYPWVSEPLLVAELARRFPEVPVIMTNGGQFNISGLGMADAWIALERFPNLRMQTAGEYRQDFIEDVSSKIGGDRVLFASSAPHFDQTYELARAHQAGMSADNRRLMLGETASWLYGLIRG